MAYSTAAAAAVAAAHLTKPIAASAATLTSASASATASAASVTSPAAWVALCGNAAPILSSVLYVAPMSTVQKVISDRSIGGLPFLPYSSMVVSAFLWMVYGLLQREAKVILPNLLGLFLGSYYFVQFRKFVPKHANNLPGTLRQHERSVAALIGCALFVSSLSASPTTAGTILPKLMSHESASKLIGNMGVTICVILFASPLSTLKTVLRTKSAKSIPLPFTIACMCNCFCWSVVGLFDMKDVYIYFPNLLGLGSALIQLFFKILYGDGNGNGNGKKILGGSGSGGSLPL